MKKNKIFTILIIFVIVSCSPKLKLTGKFLANSEKKYTTLLMKIL